MFQISERVEKMKEKYEETVRYKYLPNGDRIMRENSTTTTYYLYAREDRIADYDASGNLLIAYTHGPGIDEPVAMTLNNSTYFYIPDVQGTIRAMVDTDGNTVATYQYDVWGSMISYNGSLAQKNDYLYTGREYDWQTGIYYYRYRYYNPEIGRFMQSSWEHTKEMNMYVYVNNDPANHEDPTGHPGYQPPYLPDHGGLSICNGGCITNTLLVLAMTDMKCYCDNELCSQISGGRIGTYRRILKNVNAAKEHCMGGYDTSSLIPTAGAPPYSPIIHTYGVKSSVSHPKLKPQIWFPKLPIWHIFIGGP